MPTRRGSAATPLGVKRLAAKPARRLGRATYHHGDLRRALIDGAVAIIADRGAEAFTLREAARRLGVNHRAAYRHFADKASLLAAVAEQGFAALAEATRVEIAASGADTADARLRAMARAYVLFADEHPAHFRVMFGPRLNEDVASPSAKMTEAYRLLEAEIRGAYGDGDVTDTVIAFWAVLHGLASLVLMQRVGVRREQLPKWIDRVVGLALSGLRSSR